MIGKLLLQGKKRAICGIKAQYEICPRWSQNRVSIPRVQNFKRRVRRKLVKSSSVVFPSSKPSPLPPAPSEPIPPVSSNPSSPSTSQPEEQPPSPPITSFASSPTVYTFTATPINPPVLHTLPPLFFLSLPRSSTPSSALSTHPLAQIVPSVALPSQVGQKGKNKPNKLFPPFWMMQNVGWGRKLQLGAISSSSGALKLQDIYSLGFSLNIKHVSFKLIRWIPPSKGLVLNVDGASKGNPGTCGGGGCVRDCNGNLLFAFANFYGFGSSLVAESRSLCDGLRLALEHGFHLAEIRFDSLTLVNSISSMKVPSWKCLHWWRDALSIIQTFDINIKHTYRQANQLPDALANVGCSSQSNVLYFSAGSLPPSCKGPLTMDRSGVPSLRPVF
ncbi:hypothetical protein Taro_006857 [Colocasia esculenta]|uniref:RNase H type-1 domain-containing protein n=1 Tax=Colocasia esculenta TaxID=4460 RepID=A0A843TX98_COLES|nr:hypothetical protein [Colocasia esculenta]